MIGPTDLHGLWGFALTPFRDDRIDEAPFRAGVRGLVDGGADVVIAGGTLGQGDRMSLAERVAVLALARSEAGGAVPVLGALMAADADVAAAAAALVDAGADGALLLPASGEPADAARATLEVRRAAAGRLPIVLYQRGALRLEPSDLVELAADPTLIGLKDAHGDLRRFRRLRESLGPRLVWVGAVEDLAVAYRTHGADAVSPASMAYAPAYARRTWAAVEAGDVPEAVRLLRAFAWPMTDLRGSRPDIDLSVVVEMARAFGRPVGALRPPALPLTAAEQEMVARLADILREELAAIT